MRRSQISKSVAWPSDAKLCQVKQFRSEESPSEVQRGARDHIHEKALRPVKLGGISPGNDLPPGFEVIQPANPWRVKLPQIPPMKWKCPPTFEVNNKWQVVAGEESNELKVECQREMKVLEAIYPRPSSIPPNPSVSPSVENSFTNDQETPIVPIMPIEDDEAAMAMSSSSLAANSNTTISEPHPLSHGNLPHVNGISTRAMELDIIAAALGGLVDMNLLMKILSDPKIGENLISNRSSLSLENGPSSSQQNMPSSSFQNMPTVGAQTVTSSSLQNMPINGVQNVEQNMPNLRSADKNLFTATGSLYPSQVRAGSGPVLQPSPPDVTLMPSSSIGAPMTKDINYYKSLILQHGGGERQDPLPQFGHQKPVNFMKSSAQKRKITKPCIYFNTSKGCRNGNNCTFLHDTSSQQRVSGIPDVQSVKRVKLDGEILQNPQVTCSSLAPTPRTIHRGNVANYQSVPSAETLKACIL